MKANITICFKCVAEFWVAKFIGAIKESMHKLYFTILNFKSIDVLYLSRRKWCCGIPLLVNSFKFICGQLFRNYTAWLVGVKALDNRRFMSIGGTICIRLASIKVVVYNFLTAQAWIFFEAIHPKIHVVRNRNTAFSGTTSLLDTKGKRRESFWISVQISLYFDIFASINFAGVAAIIIIGVFYIYELFSR